MPSPLKQSHIFEDQKLFGEKSKQLFICLKLYVWLADSVSFHSGESKMKLQLFEKVRFAANSGKLIKVWK